jgi:hypothetical protein
MNNSQREILEQLKQELEDKKVHIVCGYSLDRDIHFNCGLVAAIDCINKHLEEQNDD